jgi:KDEL-tailed cysteine endopeptidase
LNHAVNVIGYYSLTNGTSFYLVKNSWGSGWGENGLIRVNATANKGNLCGICSYIYYSII